MGNQFLVFLTFDILQITHFTNRVTYSVISHQRVKDMFVTATDGTYVYSALKSDSTHHFFRNACTKSGSLRFSQFSGC